MKSDLIALVEVPTTIKGECGTFKRSIGSGYPVRDGLVLTARHVLYHKSINPEGKRIFSWRRPDAERSYHSAEVFTDDIVFEDETLDIAVVKCDTSGLDLPVSILGDFFPDQGDDWKSRGYPKAGLNDGQRQQVKAGGDFTTTDINDRFLELRSNDEISEPELWKGISGAPIFDVRRNKLVGIWVRSGKFYPKKTKEEVNREEKFKNRLVATSLPYLLNADEGCRFREVVFGTHDEWVQNYFKKVTQWLGQKEQAQKAIWKELSKTDENLRNSPEVLINCLKNMRVTELFDVMRITQNATSDVTVKAELSSILKRLLPAFYEPSCLLSLYEKKQSSGMVIGIPCSTEVSAEMLMAATDQRELDFIFHAASKSNSRKIAYPGKYRLSLPPEGGSVDENDIAEMMGDDLIRRFGLDDFGMNDATSVTDDYLYTKLAPRQRKELSPKEKKIAVQRELKRLANEPDQGTYYWLFTYEHKQASIEWQDVAIKIGQDYPQITCLSLDDNFDQQQDEEDLFSGLYSMLTTEIP